MVNDNLKRRPPFGAPGKPDPADRQETCIRCGTCCTKGGPTLHFEDKALVDDGVIPAKHLYTIREGELAFDNVREQVQQAETDIIKVKAKKNSTTCTFYNEPSTGCRIYDHRPKECRALNCSDISEIMAIYAKDRLTRKDVLGEVEGLWELIQDHQQRCSYRKIRVIVQFVNPESVEDRDEKAILELIRYDASVRSLMVEKGGMNPEMLDFLLGRPLVDTIKMFGFKVIGTGGTLQLRPL